MGTVSLSAITIEQEYTNGFKAYKSKNFQKAYNIFSSLFLSKLSDKKLNFYLGLSAYEIANYEMALAAFERVQILDPKNIRNQLEIARTYFKLKMYKNAELLFKEILNNPNLPENVQKNIELYMAKIKSVQKKSFSTVNIAIDYIYDSNVNYGSIADSYNSSLGTLNTTDKISDNAKQIYTDFTNIYDIGEKNSYAIKNKFSFFQKDYKEQNSYDIQYVSYTPSIINSDDKRYMELELNFDKLKLDKLDYLNTLAITPKFNYSHNSTYKSLVSLKFMRKYFSQSAQTNLNADHYQASYGVQSILSKNSYALVSFIGTKEEPSRAGTSPSIYSKYEDYKLNINYGKQFTKKYSMQLSTAINDRKYKEYSTILLSTRRDTGINTNLSISTILDNNFVLNTKLSYTKNLSNQAIYEYVKHTISFGISKRF